ncbi:MAG: cyclic nucleotide-binding domain-containing protein [Cyanobium sp. CZS 48M]|nr:cyclic nucleotide-binding domain-containing protein [Cyanobium sp. CZS48M]
MTRSAARDKLLRLQSVGIFAATPDTVLLELAETVEDVHLAAGEQLFAKGDLGTSMYVIVSGRVRIHIGDQTVVELNEGEIVGELAALDPEPRSASVSAIDPTTLYRIEQATLKALMADHPEIVQAVIQELAQLLRDTTAPYGYGLE